MGIRPFEPDDAEQVASLWQYWFRGRTRTPAPGLTDLVRRVYVERPDGDPEVPSLVADDGHGRVLGFLGVTTTPVLVDGKVRTLAGVFPSVRDPDAPPMIASLLLRKLLAGPQVLTFSDGGHVKFERIWEALGGRIAPTASLRWLKVFRPVQLALGSFVRKRPLGRALEPVWGPLVGGGDWIARRARPAYFGADPLACRGVPLTPEGLADAMAQVHERTRLRPAYSRAYLTWLFAEMARVRQQGTLAAELVLSPDGAPVGWWVAYLNPNELSRVFALDGAEPYLDAVVDRLFARADAAGVAALIGRLDPRLRRPMAARRAFTHNGGSLMMVHGRDARLVDDALLGRLAFGRLEGENWYWWALVSRTVP